MTVPCLEVEMRELSFAAKAVLATATALTYEMQEGEVPVHILKRTLGLSDEAWESAYEELYASGALYRVPDRYGSMDLVETRDAGNILRMAIGRGGRPSTKEWLELRSEVLYEHGHACFYCETTNGPFEIDHIHPVSRGGSNHLRNLVPACKTCNSSKGNKTWDEWCPPWAEARR